MLPLLSVLMTSYNREPYIGEAIESVLASSWTDFELIIVDDGSTDRTVAIAKHYAANDERIRVYVNEKNLGDYPNRNKAAGYARGEFIMYVDSDDKILPDGFKHCIEAMERFPAAGFGMLYKARVGEAFYMDARTAIRRHFFEAPFLGIGPGGTILRSVFFKQIGQYPVQYGPANDMYFNLKAAAAGGVVLLPFEFNFYRIHEGQEINNHFSYLYNNYNYLKAALQELPLPVSKKESQWLMNKNRRRFLVNMVRYFIDTKNIRKTLVAMKQTQFNFLDIFKAIFHI